MVSSNYSKRFTSTSCRNHNYERFAKYITLKHKWVRNQKLIEFLFIRNLQIPTSKYSIAKLDKVQI